MQIERKNVLTKNEDENIVVTHGQHDIQDEEIQEI